MRGWGRATERGVTGDVHAAASTIEQPRTPPSRRGRGSSASVVWAAAAGVFLVRLAFAWRPLGLDESGYLTIAQQWSRGSSLYGDLWVDRPPMLIILYQAAAALGGAVPLRLIGCLAASVTVLAVARAASTLSGARAGRASALLAAAFLASPLTGSAEVNGELLAAPFVAVGLAAVIEAATTVSWRRVVAASAVAGAAGVTAVLIKQNMVDVFVFAGCLGVLAWRGRDVATWKLRRMLAALVLGAAVVVLLTAAWTVSRGTSLVGVWNAVFTFRVEASGVLAASAGSAMYHRLFGLLVAGVLSGIGVLAGLLLSAARSSRRVGEPGVLGWPSSQALLSLAVLTAYVVLSMAMGGVYSIHYLVQLVVPVSVGAGVVLAGRPRLVTKMLAAVTASALLAVVLQPLTSPGDGATVGAALGRVSQPGDSVVTVWGHAEVQRSSGLSTPYPYLWSVPAKVLDPHTTRLTATLDGPDAPTWFVVWSQVNSPAVDARSLQAALRNGYHQVADLCGHRVYLRDGTDRATPHLPRAGCAEAAAQP